MGRITFLDLLATLCLMQTRIPLALIVARAHCWLMFNFWHCQRSSCYYKAPSFLMTYFLTVHMSRCTRLCPGVEGTNRFCSIATSLRAGSCCARSALLQCSCEPGSGYCENSYIVRKSCPNLFWGLLTCLGSCLGPCICSLPDLPLLTWSWTCLEIWAVPHPSTARPALYFEQAKFFCLPLAWLYKSYFSLCLWKSYQSGDRVNVPSSTEEDTGICCRWKKDKGEEVCTAIYFCCSLAMASNTGPHGCSITPPPTGVGRRMERKRQKLVGHDKGSLPEQQMKRTVTTTILTRRIYKTNSKTHRPTLTSRPPAAPEPWLTSPLGQLPPPEPSTVAHSIEYPVLFGHFGSTRPSVSPPGFWWKLTLSWTNPGQFSAAILICYSRNTPLDVYDSYISKVQMSKKYY